MKYYYANASNQPTGPYSITDLQQLASSGTITATTAIITEGSSQWLPLSQVLGLSTPASTASTQPQQAESPADALLGALMIILSFFTIPATLLRGAFRDCAQWGRARQLPSSTSELPSMTYLTIVCRPLFHFVWLIAWLFVAPVIFMRVNDREFGGMVDGSNKLTFIVGCALAAYFGQVVVGLVVDSLGAIVRISNDVNRMSRRS